VTGVPAVDASKPSASPVSHYLFAVKKQNTDGQLFSRDHNVRADSIIFSQLLYLNPLHPPSQSTAIITPQPTRTPIPIKTRARTSPLRSLPVYRLGDCRPFGRSRRPVLTRIPAYRPWKASGQRAKSFSKRSWPVQNSTRHSERLPRQPDAQSLKNGVSGAEAVSQRQ
jgi:hypothetical protein